MLTAVGMNVTAWADFYGTEICELAEVFNFFFSCIFFLLSLFFIHLSQWKWKLKNLPK